ncbi:MAG: SH3 domain-containing protein [Lachnospiraceae bacterium]|nr:SH3 domain-containing protein [Lachnospiraceae bacterium]
MAGKAQRTKIWKGLLAAVALVFALVMLSDAFATVSLAATGKANSNANIRKSASKNSEAVGSTTKGSKLEILSQTTGDDGKIWYEVTVNATTKGYVRSDLVDLDAGQTVSGSEGSSGGSGTSTSSGEVESVTPVGATVAGSNTVRVRTSASTTSSNNILTTVTKGTEVTVIGKVIGSDKKTWYQVKLTVEGKDVVGYVRSDYLAITGEIKPLEADPGPVDPVETDPVETDPTPKETETVTPVKRYETALENDKWKLIDYENAVQYDIDDLFSAAQKYKELYEAADKKSKAKGGWLIFFIIVAIAACAGVGYLFYRMREIREEAYINNIESNTPRRTADRPRGEARGGQNGRPAIRDGLEPRRDDQRPANGQRSSGNRPRQGGRPAQGQPQQGRPTQGQPQNGRPAQQGNPQQARPAQQGNPQQGRPAQPGQPQQARPAQGQPQQARPAQQAQPQDGRPQQTAARPKNFAQDSDDMEFEFLNWDSDE